MTADRMTEERVAEIESLRGQVKECGEWRFCFNEERGGQGGVYAGFYCVAEFDDDGNGRFVAGAPKAVDDLLTALRQSESANASLRAEVERLRASESLLLSRNEELVDEKAAERGCYERRIERMRGQFIDLSGRLEHARHKVIGLRAEGNITRAKEAAIRFADQVGFEPQAEGAST